MEFYEHNIVYRFCENAESDEFPLYELGYIPDGFELEREVVTESFRKMKYKNSKTGEGVVFEYRYYTGFLNVNLWEPSGGMKSEKVYINDTISDYYSGNEKMDNNILVLVSNKMVFIITSNMEKTEIIKIAEQISEINK